MNNVAWTVKGALWPREDGSLSMKVEQDIKKDEKVYVFLNKYAGDNPKAPKWRILTKNENQIADVPVKQDQQDIPW